MKKIQTTAVAFALIAVIALAVAGAFAGSGDGGRARPEKTAEDYVAEGLFYYEQGTYPEALASYKQALELEENNLDALRGQARTCINLSCDDEAEKAYYALTEQDGATIDDRIETIEFLVRKNKLDDAKSLIEKFMAADPDDRYKEIYDQMVIDVPELSLKSGTYDNYQWLTVKSVPENSLVYYTIDGSEPTRESAVISDGIVISYPKNKIKVKAIGNMGYESKTVELNVNITKKVEEVKLTSGDSSYQESVLENCLRNALNKSYDDKYYNYETAQITSLYLLGEYRYSIESMGTAVLYSDSYNSGNLMYPENNIGQYQISGLKYFPYLQKLCIGYQQKFDPTQLKSLKHLKELSLVHCNISDISVLKNLESLERLCLGWNNISEIGDLSSLKNLWSLGLWNNKIKNIDKISGLTELTYLDIANNNVSDISVIKNMTKLSEVWVNGNKIKDMSPFAGMTGIRTLMQEGNPGSNDPVFDPIKGNLIKTDLR